MVLFSAASYIIFSQSYFISSPADACAYVFELVCYITLSRESGRDDDSGNSRNRFDGQASAIFGGIGGGATR